MRRIALLTAACLAALPCAGQVYSPKVLLEGQPDAGDLHRIAEAVYIRAGAHTPRQRAEAIWRYFLTDGRFVTPAFWYHIAGWAYEEPRGEVIDPVKLLNSYGFGLCYQIAPVLEAVWKAGGFEDARVWFLTGHTVAEVYYDGAYHYFDSDMMGYNPIGNGPVKQLPVASVHQIEMDGSIILSKMKGPKEADASRLDQPWYPADVREAAMGGLAELFTTREDNRLFPFERASQGHRMDFVLRPGERMVRYFQPEQDGLFYLPYKFQDGAWLEFPQEFAQYRIRTADGPRSQKDQRRWATGRIEYRPPAASGLQATYDVRSPYVIIDATFEMQAALDRPSDHVAVETSVDGGRTWTPGATLRGPYSGAWRAEPAVLTRSEHGRRTAVSGMYGYRARISRSRAAVIRNLLISTRFQLNPRTLPELAPGQNQLVYSAGPPRTHHVLPVTAARARDFAERVSNARYVSNGDQGYWLADRQGPAEFMFRLDDAAEFDAGGRFLDLSGGQAPDKFTAEVRPAAPLSASGAAASIAWATSPDGPFQTVWTYDPSLRWKDGVTIDRVLRWPEVDRHVSCGEARTVYVRYRVQGLAVDDFRLESETPALGGTSPVTVTHVWTENGVERSSSQTIPAGAAHYRYRIDIPPGVAIANRALIIAAR